MIDYQDTLYATRVLDPYGLFEAVKTLEGVRSQAHALIKATAGSSTEGNDLKVAVQQLRSAHHAAHQLVSAKVLDGDVAIRFQAVNPPLPPDAGLLALRTACALELAFLAGVVESDGFVATSVLAARSTRDALSANGSQMTGPAALTAGGNYL